jgi:hypothetical protein
MMIGALVPPFPSRDRRHKLFRAECYVVVRWCLCTDSGLDQEFAFDFTAFGGVIQTDQHSVHLGVRSGWAH